MKKLIPITLLLAGIATHAPTTWADWWSDNGDTADAQDIDSGAQPETSTDDDLVKDAQGPGQPQNDPASGVPVIYDGYGNTYAYGMPYGYGPSFGYGDGYIQTVRMSGFGR